MNSKQRLLTLERCYREQLEAYQRTAYENAQLVQAGKHPSNDQLLDEREAAVALAFTRDELRRELSMAVGERSG